MDETSSSPKRDTASINQARWHEVTDLFDRCLAMAAEEREQLLSGADDTLAREVRSLLESYDPEADGLQSPADQILSPPQKLPHQIGAYRVERLLGEGGMGSVFLARRVGEFDQVVAVKLIRRDFGLAAERLIQRFRQERQILATLQHPYIAHLIDGGTSDERPYLVVEYVPGIRIDEYCNRNRLSIRRRIELFLKVCEAVQYAHQNLIVHRDLKPANILVLDDGTPKLLDFGIAKLLRQDDTASDVTRTLMKIFTPSYASPEQLRGELVGTPSDVYSLGVMLYELLTGQKPHLVDTSSDFVMLDAICNRMPPTASTAIKRYPEEVREARAAERTTRYASWGKMLRNDLDLILAHSIAAEPARRYQSVEQFSSDLSRYLASLPITARRDSWSYRAGKFWSRHRPLVAVASLASILLIIAGCVLWREYRVAVEQRQRAERRFNDLRALAHSNVTEVQDALDRLPGGTAVRSLILGRTLTYLDSLAAEKDNDIDLQRNLATAYMLLAQRLGNPASGNLGDTAGANANYDHSLRIREAIVASSQATEKDHFDLIYLRYQLALMQAGDGHYEAAGQTLAQAAGASDAILAGSPQDIAAAYHYVSVMHKALSDVLFDSASTSLADPVQGMRHAGIALQAAEQAYNRQPQKASRISQLITVKQGKADKLFALERYDEGIRLQKSILDFAKSSQGALLAKDDDVFIYADYRYAVQLAKKDPRAAVPWADATLAAIVNERKSDPTDLRMAAWYASAMTDFGNVHWLAGERLKGSAMMAAGIAQLTSLLSKNPAGAGEFLYYPLAGAHQSLGDQAGLEGDLHQALSHYQSADQFIAEDIAKIPDDLEAYARRAENQLSIAGVQTKLKMTKQASASRLLAVENADRVLRIHPDNPVAQNLRTRAMALQP